MLPKYPVNRLLISVALLIALIGNVSWLINLLR